MFIISRNTPIKSSKQVTGPVGQVVTSQALICIFPKVVGSNPNEHYNSLENSSPDSSVV